MTLESGWTMSEKTMVEKMRECYGTKFRDRGFYSRDIMMVWDEDLEAVVVPRPGKTLSEEYISRVHEDNRNIIAYLNQPRSLFGRL